MVKEKYFIDEVIRLATEVERVNNIDIIGMALLNLGVKDENFDRLRTKDILHSFFGFSRKTSYWADSIQYFQDVGLSWEDALHETNLILVKRMLSNDNS